ncbi:protein TIFY 10b-like isoform X2 [Punica granatum]|uniref:Protein TIFY n=2 Tax=Punica granatum TaxID=22663 RepID=A0A218WPG7_PUNGR|nr:protein TIFY 10b-like isoform X2 [Punica granatum]OWM74379.1 hypothetical protein CDL15_Pgr013283 [Punica granatum]PKI34987.1 hypothetical protein CRG98_044618 [Punica granatum]
MTSSSSQTVSGKVLPEKPSFSQTCSLLSQYLKEKGTFGDVSLGLNGNGVPEMFQPVAAPAATMNLFPVNEKPAVKSMDLFPNGKGDSCKRVDSSEATQKKLGTAPMTIFYGGQVIVFNDFPADKAKEVMMLASKASSSTGSNPHLAAFGGPNLAQNSMRPGGMFSQNSIHDRIHRPAEPIASDLPIARRASLHRFLEKRKDRVTARSPYAGATSEATPPKPSESKPWLGLAAQPTQ